MVILEVCNLDRFMAMMALKSGLQKNTFLFFLEKIYPQSFVKILTKVEKYTNVEEAYDAHPVPVEAKAD